MSNWLTNEQTSEQTSEQTTIRTLPSIECGNEVRINNIDTTNRIIIQEKIDGSQLTIFKRNGELHFYNKNTKINPQGAPWKDAWLSLQNKKDWFVEGYFYHGEAMKQKNQTNVNVYKRYPKYCWIVYEIVKENNYVLTPDEMNYILRGTQLETTPLIYDNKNHDDYVDDYVGNYHADTITLQRKIDIIMEEIEKKEIESCLGNSPEGIVVKVLNVTRIENETLKYSTTRYKFVRPIFSEKVKQKRTKDDELSDGEFIDNIGMSYNTDARKQKAMLHLKERGEWNYDNFDKNIPQMVHELNNDLLKEEREEIETALFVHFFPTICKVAQGNIKLFMLK